MDSEAMYARKAKMPRVERMHKKPMHSSTPNEHAWRRMRARLDVCTAFGAGSRYPIMARSASRTVTQSPAGV